MATWWLTWPGRVEVGAPSRAQNRVLSKLASSPPAAAPARGRSKPYTSIRKSGLTRHGEIRDLGKRELGLGHGDANTLAKFYLEQANGRKPAGGAQPAAAAAPDEKVDEIYSGARARLRPLHDKVMAAIGKFGPFEISPKKTYLSLRRKKQFVMLGPGTKGRLELGLNMKGVLGGERLAEQPAGGMCQYKVFVSDAKEVDKELIGWMQQAYDSAG